MTNPSSPYRPISGGTHHGSRPQLFTYWRVGYGQTEGVALDFWIEQAGEYHCEPPHDYPITDYQLERWTRVFYVTHGTAKWLTSGQETLLKPGDVLVVPPKQPGIYQALQPHHYHWLGLAGVWPSFLGERPQTIRQSPGIDAELQDAFIGLRESLILGQSGYALKAVSHFYAIFSRIHRLSNLGHPPSGYPDTVRNALIYLEENYVQPFQAAEVAAKVNISPSHLRALFERWVGQSPKSYHTHCRINLAKQLLAQQSLSIEIISGQVGFNDVSSFSRVFKQRTGVSPSQYLKKREERSEE